MGGVFFATPAYDGTVTVPYMESFLPAWEVCYRAAIAARKRTIVGDCYVHKARNTLAADFLESDSSDLFFIDADVGGYQPGDVLRVLARPFDFVAGIYPFKTEDGGYPARLSPGPDGNPVVDEKTGCVRMEMVPTGFWRVRRSVLEAMKPHVGTYLYRGRRYHNFFYTPIIDDIWHGEDPAFCRLWRMMGGEIWAEPDIDFVHTGTKHWPGNFSKFLKAHDGHSAEAITRAAFGIKP